MNCKYVNISSWSKIALMLYICVIKLYDSHCFKMFIDHYRLNEVHANRTPRKMFAIASKKNDMKIAPKTTIGFKRLAS